VKLAELRSLSGAFWINWQRLGWVILFGVWSRVLSIIWRSGQRWRGPIGANRLVVISLVLLLLWGPPTASLAATPAPIAWQAPITAGSAAETQRERLLTIGTSKPNVDNIPAAKIDQFVHAYQQVLALVQQRQGELQAAETESLAQGLEREIEATAMGLIEQTGLTHEEYFQLLGLASVDSELGDTIATLLQESPR
jgi:Domain of unknown function (DUF4168)